MKEFISKIDLFGKKYSFEEAGSQKFTTVFGIVLTLIAIIVSLIIGFLFGNEIYQRNQPIVTVKEQKMSYSSVSVDEYPIFFHITDIQGNDIPLTSINT